MTVVDQFPADVNALVGGERVTFREVRLLVAGHQARVLGLADGQPAVMAAATVVGTPPHWSREVHSLATEAGEWRVDRHPGCGCHHPLKLLARQAALAAAGLA